MPLTTLERAETRKAISDLLNGHCTHPFHILRERGAVAELRAQLLLGTELRQPVRATVTRHRPWSIHRTSLPEEFPVDVQRVQLELSVSDHPSDIDPDALSSKDIDIGILSSTPELLVASNGPGDVLQQLRPHSLAAAIEVKACPTVDAVQRGHCVKDLLALLWLREHHAEVDGFFVLLDKSHAHYGPWVGRTTRDAPMAWDSGLEQEIVCRRRNRAPDRHHSLRSAGLEIWDQAPPGGVPFVELWTLAQVDGKWQVDCRYATRASAQSRHLSRTRA